MNHSATTAKSVLGNLLSLSKPLGKKPSSKPSAGQPEPGSSFNQTLAGVGKTKVKVKAKAATPAPAPAVPNRPSASQRSNPNSRSVGPEESSSPAAKQTEAQGPAQTAGEKTPVKSTVAPVLSKEMESAPGDQAQDPELVSLLTAPELELTAAETTDTGLTADGIASGQTLPPGEILISEAPRETAEMAAGAESAPVASGEEPAQGMGPEVFIEAPAGISAGISVGTSSAGTSEATAAPGEEAVVDLGAARKSDAKGPQSPPVLANGVDMKMETPPTAGLKSETNQGSAPALENVAVDKAIPVMAGLQFFAKSELKKEAVAPADSSPQWRAATQVAPALDALTRAAESLTPTNRGFVVQTPVGPSLGHPQWNQAVGDRVLWLAAQKISAAELRLDPPELGPMQVRVAVHQDQVQVTFTSPHASVRDALDQGAARLREMFSEQGLSLNVEVSDQSLSRHPRQSEANQNRSTVNALEEEAPVAETLVTNHRLIDHYA